MPYLFPPDVNALVCAHMSSGKYASEDELLRAALEALAEEGEDLAAVRESLDDWRAGDPGVPLESAFASIRSRRQHGQTPFWEIERISRDLRD